MQHKMIFLFYFRKLFFGFERLLLKLRPQPSELPSSL
jgi:hypothetical protein